MEPIVIERHSTPRGDLQLQRRGENYEIISNGVFLMATYNGESERLLVTAALEAAATPRRVLVGGLGVGFSLAAALADPRVEHVTVVEIEEPLIDWNRRFLAPFSGNALSDPRTRVVHGDLLEWITATEERFDAICLDIDNGPTWTVTDENQGLYDDRRILAVRGLLAPGGAVAYWSAQQEPAFAERLARHFAEVRELPVEQARGVPDYVYIARELDTGEERA
ncbi:MAG TPA: spermine/spermidine synthase [Symbiobacteriaceae bacterium]|nr:spermine/spermidine synthase [Symbiobacteriaceae bacterium]